MDASCAFVIAGRAVLFSEEKGDPLVSYPSVECEGLPYNRWLSENVLEVVLGRWSCPLDVREDGAMHSHGLGGETRPGDRVYGSDAVLDVAGDVEWACGQSRLGFEAVLPAASRLGDPAIIAAMGVALNLQRTVALLGEFLIDDRPISWPRPPIRLSRWLCGLIDYSESSPYFPGRIHPPVPASRLRTRRLDLRHLGNALWCSPAEIERTCEAAMAVLREEIRRLGIFR